MYKLKYEMNSYGWEHKIFAIGGHTVLRSGYLTINIFLGFWDVSIEFFKVRKLIKLK